MYRNKIIVSFVGFGLVSAALGGYFLYRHFTSRTTSDDDNEIVPKTNKELVQYLKRK
jgi:hypothetical protein